MQKKSKMIIFVSSRLRGDIENNMKTAERLCRKVMQKGYIAIAPHIYFTRFLDELNEEERKQGIAAGLELLKLCDEVWVFNFSGISEGMQEEIALAENLRKKVKYFGSEDEI